MMNNPMNNMMNMRNNQMNNMMNMPMNNFMNIPMNNMMNMPMQIDNNHMIKEGMAKKSNNSGKRKIPPILLKNKNIQIERITFPVEKGLKRTGETYFKKNVNEIFNELFSKRKKIKDEKET